MANVNKMLQEGAPWGRGSGGRAGDAGQEACDGGWEVSAGAKRRRLLEALAGGSCWRKLLEAVAVIQEVAAVILAAVGLEMIFESFLRTL